MVVLPPVIHGGTVITEFMSWGGIVLGAYCSLELVRFRGRTWSKSPAVIGLAIYGVLAAVGLYYAIPRLF